MEKHLLVVALCVSVLVATAGAQLKSDGMQLSLSISFHWLYRLQSSI